MRIQTSGLLKVKLATLSVVAAIFTILSVGSASASSLNLKSPSIHLAVAENGVIANFTKVHHRSKRRWRKRGGFYIHFGSPYYYGYRGYYPRYRYCRKWNRRCGYRYGWRSWRYDRCMRRKGC